MDFQLISWESVGKQIFKIWVLQTRWTMVNEATTNHNGRHFFWCHTIPIYYLRPLSVKEHTKIQITRKLSSGRNRPSYRVQWKTRTCSVKCCYTRGSSEERRRRLWNCTTWYSLRPVWAVPWVELYTTHHCIRITPTTRGQDSEQPGRKGKRPYQQRKSVGRKVFDDDLYRGFHLDFFTFMSANGGIDLKGKQRIRPITITIQAESEGLPYTYPDYYHQRSHLTLRQLT